MHFSIAEGIKNRLSNELKKFVEENVARKIRAKHGKHIRVVVLKL